MLKIRGSVRQQGPKLIIEDAGREDGGKYVCLAQNSAGTALLEVDVSILVPPTLNIAPRWTAISGLPFTIQPTQIRGFPEPKLSWYRNGRAVVPSEILTFDEKTGRLLFVVLNTEDSGRYVLKAESAAGYDEREISLVVLKAPWIRMLNGDNKQIKVRPPMRYSRTFFKNNRKV